MKTTSSLFLLIFIFSSFIFKPGDLCPNTRSYDNLEEALKEPEKVIKLDLSMQKLTTAPLDVTKFVNLECLDLSFNRITDLPVEYAKLKKLKYIDLSGTNYMAKLPAVLKQLPDLQEVDITDHKFWKPAQFEAAKKMLPKVKVITHSDYDLQGK